jgi:cyclically-permuted mutarotase family protein
MNKKLCFFLLLQSLLISGFISAQRKYNLRWKVAATLPVNEKLGKQPGLAGVFSGFVNGELVIAGGCNFPDSMPWQGGKKVYWNDIYILHINKGGKCKWVNRGEYKLKENIAYGASVQMKEGVVCIGGENETGISKKVFLLHGNDIEKKIVFTDLPDLPLPLTNLSAIGIGSDIYVAGGETGTVVSNHFFKLNIHQHAKGWIALAPVPIEVSHAVLVEAEKAFTPYIYLAGGRKRNSNGISDFYSSTFEYDIEKNQWTRKKDLPYAASAAIGLGGRSADIFFIGGDKGDTFHKVETLLAAIDVERDGPKKQQLVKEKNQLLIDHPGFNKDVLVYNLYKDEWRKAGQMNLTVPVTTLAVKGDHKYYIPCGEIKAGIRTAQILVSK